MRDLLLGRPPKDYDVATAATPQQVLGLFPDAIQVGAHFGVVLVQQEGAQVEVATFRSDHAYADGRHPGEVRFETDPAADARRRDFTINALFLDPATEQVLDFTGGQQDLRDGIVRAIGDPETRFREDHLRLLRAVRFAARLGFSLDAATREAARRLAHCIHRVSAERIRQELTGILTQGQARRGFELLDECGLLKELLPEVAAMQGCEQNADWHPEGDVWVHTLMMLDAMRDPTPALAWGVLLHDVGKPPCQRRDGERIRFDGHAEVGARMTGEILGRLRCSHDETQQASALVANHMRFKDVPQMRESTVKRFLRMDRFDEHLELHRIDCSCSHGMLGIHDALRRRLDETPPEELAPPRLVTGNDLKASGYAPGPQFTEMLRVVEDAQLEGAIHTREEGLALVRERFGA